jgi:uncharacterized protein DUF3592
VTQRPKSFFGLAKRSFAFWFGGIWFFVGAPFLIIGTYVGIDTFHQQARFEREGQVTQGTVLTKSITRRKDSEGREGTSYWVGYRFTAPDGAVVKREALVSGELWDRLVEREPVRVTFLPGDPQTNRIEGESSAWMLPIILTGLGLVFAPIGGYIFFLRGVAGILRELRLQSEGAVAEATVVEVEPTNISLNGVPQWRIRYRYRDHRGQTHTGASNVMAPEEAQEWKAGDTGTVRFDARAPKKSIWVGRA